MGSITTNKIDLCSTSASAILGSVLMYYKSFLIPLDGLHDEFQELVCMYQRNETIKATLDACTSKTSFEGGWGILGTQFQKLKRLCGGFASVFPGTSTVESDFSVIGWEKNEYQTALTDF